MSKQSRPAKKAPPTGVAPEITSYSTAIRYLTKQTNYERMRVTRIDQSGFQLDGLRKVLTALGQPQEQVRAVHVAGTVGKGSTAGMISSMLQGCGYAVGLFTSPHLNDARERISINGQDIDRPSFAQRMREATTAAAEVGVELTYFELLTTMAFLHFAEEAVDLAVLEVGLGGRLDSTNVVTPEVSVITRIDIDHTQLLGSTLEEIAAEKAGIFKRGVPALTCIQDPAVEAVLAAKAEEIGAPLRVLGRDIEFSSRFGSNDELGPHTRVCVLAGGTPFMHVPVPLPGEHQAINCGLALSVVDSLKGLGFNFAEPELYDGLGATKLPGRMEVVWDQPRVLIDGAHNAASLDALMRSVGAQIPYDSMVCIFGCCEDKDIPAMLSRLVLGGDKIIFTRAKSNARSAFPEDLQRMFTEQCGKMSQTADTLQDALRLATRAVGRDDLICVTGSFYLAGEARKLLMDQKTKKLAATK